MTSAARSGGGARTNAVANTTTMITARSAIGCGIFIIRSPGCQHLWVTVRFSAAPRAARTCTVESIDRALDVLENANVAEGYAEQQLAQETGAKTSESYEGFAWCSGRGHEDSSASGRPWNSG